MMAARAEQTFAGRGGEYLPQTHPWGSPSSPGMDSVLPEPIPVPTGFPRLAWHRLDPH